VLQGRIKPETVGEIKATQVETDAMLEIEDLKWKQREKVHWVQNINGDRNTKFFHLYANQRKKTNYISVVNDDAGVNCTHLEDISRAFMEYYKTIFSTSGHIVEDDYLAALEERVTPKMNEQHGREFSREEIGVVILQMSPLKSPSLDGFVSRFYQKYWPLTGEDVCQAIIYCLSSSRSY
jgi:hypothetical protein